jgi:hypothetical protein
MSEVDYFKMQVRKMASAKKAAEKEEEDEEQSPQFKFMAGKLAGSVITPIKSTKTSGTKSPTNAKSKSKKKKKKSAPKPPPKEEDKLRKPSPTVE